MSRTRMRPRAAFAIAALLLALVPTIALAAPASPSAITWASAQVSLNLTDQHGPLMIVSAALPESTPLPATVRLAVPEGAEIQWVGEILGGDPSADPALQFESSQAASGTVITFTLTKSRTAQAEMKVPAYMLSTDPTAAKIVWASADPIASARLGVLMPAGSVVTSASQGATEAPAEDMVAFSRSYENVAAGAPLELAVAYTPPAGSAGLTGANAGAQAPAQSPTWPWLLLAAVAVIFAVVMWPRRTAGDTDDEAAPEEGAESFEPTEEPAAPAQPTKAAKAAAPTAASDGSAEEPPVARKRGIQPKHIVVLVILSALIGLAYVASAGQPGTVTREGDSITKIVSRSDGDAEARFTIVSLEGADLDHESSHMFQAVESINGIEKIALLGSTMEMVITYDSSSVSEDAFAQALTQAGYLAPSAPASGTPTP